MPNSTYYPSRQAELLLWAEAFQQGVQDRQAVLQLPQELLDRLSDSVSAFATGMARIADIATRTRGAIAWKDEKRTQMIAVVREVVDQIQVNPGVDDQMRRDLGITVRDRTPSPVPVPDAPPMLIVMDTTRFGVKVRLKNIEEQERRAKSAGVKGATILGFIGDVPSDDPMQWVLLGSTSKTRETLAFPLTTPPGSKVWLTAYWFNNKMQAGPLCMPVSACLRVDGMAQAA